MAERGAVWEVQVGGRRRWESVLPLSTLSKRDPFGRTFGRQYASVRGVKAERKGVGEQYEVG